MAGGENSSARSADCGCVVCEDGGGGVVKGAHPAGAAPERDRESRSDYTALSIHR